MKIAFATIMGATLLTTGCVSTTPLDPNKVAQHYYTQDDEIEVIEMEFGPEGGSITGLTSFKARNIKPHKSIMHGPQGMGSKVLDGAVEIGKWSIGAAVMGKALDKPRTVSPQIVDREVPIFVPVDAPMAQ